VKPQSFNENTLRKNVQAHSVVAVHSPFCNLVNNLEDTGAKHTSITLHTKTSLSGAFVGHIVLRAHVSPIVNTSVKVGILIFFFFNITVGYGFLKKNILKNQPGLVNWIFKILKSHHLRWFSHNWGSLTGYKARGEGLDIDLDGCLT
jgi:hypothetical protein